MNFSLPVYCAPDFSQSCFLTAPDVVTVPAPSNGVAPDNYHATSIFPEYFKVNGNWLLLREGQMECCVVLRDDEAIEAVPFRDLKKGDRVILGRTGNGENGIFIHSDCFSDRSQIESGFSFRLGRSRETAFSQDYDTLYNLLVYEREHHNNIIWVLGSACAFDSDARASMRYLIEKGFVQGILAGNGLAVFDLEASLMGTALGQDIYSQIPRYNGQYNHIDTINKIRACGSIEAFIHEYNIHNGIIEACVRNHVPFILSGSIRDEGPLPEIIKNSEEAQNAMKEMIRTATTMICMATQLHTIASCNLAPCYRCVGDQIRPLFIYSVDVTEFAIRKLRNRGALTSTGIITNVQDFIVMLAKSIQKRTD